MTYLSMLVCTSFGFVVGFLVKRVIELRLLEHQRRNREQLETYPDDNEDWSTDRP